jgi:hypothetical protein
LASECLLFVVYRLRGDRVRIISAQLAEPYKRRQYHEKTAERTKAQRTKHDWNHIDAMTAAERHAAALADPDAQPLTAEDFARSLSLG